jgi:hypothetical protein
MKYVQKSPEDEILIIDRIVSWNNVHLPGAQGVENKRVMHNFLDVLMKHFVRVGDFMSATTDPTATLKQVQTSEYSIIHL